MDDKIKADVKAILMKYCNPKKEFDHIEPDVIVTELIKAVRGY